MERLFEHIERIQMNSPFAPSLEPAELWDSPPSFCKLKKKINQKKSTYDLAGFESKHNLISIEIEWGIDIKEG